MIGLGERATLLVLLRIMQQGSQISISIIKQLGIGVKKLMPKECVPKFGNAQGDGKHPPDFTQKSLMPNYGIRLFCGELSIKAVSLNKSGINDTVIR